ncbi:MAG TPA: GNAT family N-acetyltransferase [Candidatus Dormibacteraeota bacterium]|nr:GNAT family N-acetyltransferase [Candidatus Dormibacteraeota bacterium]
MALFPGDDAPTTRHLGVFEAGILVGIASLYVGALPEESECNALQLRGMAVAPEQQGRGLGRALVHACINEAQAAHVDLLWCNARTSAAEFYRKLSFQTIGPEFHIPDVGPHSRMFIRVKKPK